MMRLKDAIGDNNRVIISRFDDSLLYIFCPRPLAMMRPRRDAIDDNDRVIFSRFNDSLFYIFCSRLLAIGLRDCRLFHHFS